ncbi:gp436 family protein [Thauera butanivorans]|uniref:gp436 family protein n=1 Tax=Thauera butanivorans TaxID=86174 RepID=UPI000838A092|nr:DUF1320 domain-containing protein [Thauera butanivorans]
MPYSSQSDLIDHFGLDELVELTDRATPPAGVIDVDVLAHAQATADAEIDGYIGLRYPLPFVVIPPRLRDLACDITRYHLYIHAAPELVIERYKRAIAFLILVSDGRATLGLAEESGSAGMGLAEISTGRRLFARGDRR